MISNPVIIGGGLGAETVTANLNGISPSIVQTPSGYDVIKGDVSQVIKGSIFVALYNSRDYPVVSGGVKLIETASGAVIYYVTGDFSRTY